MISRRAARSAGPASRVAGLLVGGVLALGLVGGCTGKAQPSRLLFSIQGSTMGTYYVVKVVLPASEVDESAPPPDELILPLVEEELGTVDRLMSNYRDDSELSRFNAAASTDPVAVSPETLEVFAAALELGELTGGALDITVGPLVEAWGFGPGGEAPTPPGEAELEELMARVGREHLEVDAEAGTVRKDSPELRCDLSSLAKGYGVDRVLERLRSAGYENVLVEIGGEVRTAGVNVEGAPWRLGIESPFAARGGLQRIVTLEDEALATSGDYRNYRELDGRRVSHLIDPRRGEPIGHRLASVSVVDSTCMRADALATALMVLGEEEGFELAEREGLAVLFLVREGEGFFERTTSRFTERFMPATATGG